jgi:uncharacterized iron-regulated membrane protein
MTDTPGTARAGQQQRSRRPFRLWRLMLVVHNWLGLKLFLVLAVIFLTGTLAVFRYEIDQLLYSELRVEPGDSLASLDDILAAIRITYPEMGLGGDIPTGEGAGNLAIGVLGVSPDRGIRMIWVDPYRAVVQGDTPLMTPGAFLASLHRDFFIPEWGLTIVCASAIVLTVSIITGLLAYPKFWRGFLHKPRTRNWRILMADLHKLGGLWSLWFAIVMALTGLWYFWTLVGEPMMGFPTAAEARPLPELAAKRVEALGPEIPATVPLATALARVAAAYPDFVAGYVTLPDRHGAPVVFNGSRGELLAPYATKIAVDPFSGEILGANLLGHAPVLTHVGAMVTPLHYGNFGGLLVKSIWFLFGLVLTALAVTGIVIFWVRTSRATAEFLPTMLRAFHPWRGAMGWFKPLNWAVLGLSVVAAYMTAQFYATRLADAPARYDPQAVGPWRLGVTLIAGIGDTSDPVAPGNTAVAVVEYCPGCWDEIRRLWVSVGPTPPPDVTQANLVQGQPGFAFAGFMLPQDLDESSRLWIMAEGWDRRIHQSDWPLRRSD